MRATCDWLLSDEKKNVSERTNIYKVYYPTCNGCILNGLVSVCLLCEVTNTPGVQYVVPSGLFTHIIYTLNVGYHTLPHFDV